MLQRLSASLVKFGNKNLDDYLDYLNKSILHSPEDFREEGDTDVQVLQKWIASGEPVLRTGGKRYIMDSHVVIDRPVIIINDGAIFEQTSWGYPCFEIKSKDIKMLGRWVGEYNGGRSVVISGNTLGYPYVTEGDWKAYGCFIWMNYYEGRDISNFYIEYLDVKGFIGGIWFTGRNAKIEDARFEDVDFGVFGVVYDNQVVGNIYHKNITASQGHEGHALYTNGTGKGLKVGNVYVDGSPLGCSPVKLHRTKNFHIDSIHAVGVGSVAYFHDGTTGKVGDIYAECSVNASFTGPGGQAPSNYNLLALGEGTEVVLGDTQIYADQNAANKTASLQMSGGGKFVLAGSLHYVNTNSSPAQPSLLFTTSKGKLEAHGQICAEHPNSLMENYVFNLLSYAQFDINIPPRVKAGSGVTIKLLRNTVASDNNYFLAYDPALMQGGIGEDTITCTGNSYFNVEFRGRGNVFNVLSGATPIVTHTSQANLSQSAPIDLQRLRYMSSGQRLLLRNTGGNTNIGNNRHAGLDGNILTGTGGDISRSAWTFAEFAKIGTEVHLISLK